MVGALREDMGLSNTSGEGTGEYCNPPTIIPGTQTNTKKILSAFAFASVGDVVILSPDAIDGVTWSWSGPDNFTSDSRAVIFESIQRNQGGKYVVTCTNECGETSSREFTVIVSEGQSYYVIENHDTKWWLRPQTDQVGSQMVGVEPDENDLYTHWEKIDTDNGWFYLKNRVTGMYFRPLSEEQPEKIEQVETSNSGNRVQWRFVGTENGYGHLMNREYYHKIRILSTDINNNYIEQTGAGNTSGWTQWTFKVIEQNTTNNAFTEVLDEPLSIVPNPSRETATITCVLSQKNRVFLKVYNTLGQEVATLADGGLYPVGEHTFKWNSTNQVGFNIPSGSVYMVRLTVGNQSYQSKMVVLH